MAKKGGGAQTVTQQLDPAAEQYRNLIYGTAQQAAGQGYTPYGGQTVAGASGLSSGAAGQFQNASGLAGLGVGAIGGDPAALGQFLNPFQDQVMGALGQQFDKTRGQATLDANDQATRAGAFGGSRHGVMLGERLGQIDAAQGQANANLLYGGFNDAQGRAFQAANLGLGAAGQAANMGDYFRNIQQQSLDDSYRRFTEQRDWGQRQLGILQGGMSGVPYGTSTSQPLNRNTGASILGGAATGASIGSMIPGVGTAIGAGVGGLIGLL